MVEADPARRLVFLDASVLIAASHSATGGSALVLQVCQGKIFRAAVSEMVLAEARVNIIEKFPESDLLRFYQQLAATGPVIVNPPSPETLERCVSVVGQKDAHVLGAALDCNANYLLTLDRRHLITPMTTSLPVTIMTPGDFLKRILSGEHANSDL